MKILTKLLFWGAFLCLGTVYAQHTPGGVSGAEIWFKTIPQTDNLQGYYLWKDFSGDSTKVRYYDAQSVESGREYTLGRAAVRHYNFNPAIDLSEIGGNKQFLLGKTNLAQATIISVWGPDYGDFNQDMYLYAMNGRAGEGYLFTKDKVLQSKESNKDILDYGKTEGSDLLYQQSDKEPNITKFRERALRVVSHFRTLQPNTSIWGEKNEALIKISDVYYPTLAGNNSTYDLTKLNNRSFYGYTPEFIIYNRMLTPIERRKVESYLAVKYAFTLEKSYIGSNEQLLWDVDNNKEYNTRVTGYGRDEASGLYQKKSISSQEESPYFSDLAAYDTYDLNNSYNLSSRYRHLMIGRQPGSPMNNGEFVLFGDNDQTFKTAKEENIGGIKLMQRRWLLNTDMQPDTAKPLEWRVQNLDVYTEGFKTKLTRQGTSSQENGSVVTPTALLDKDGYFSWTITGARRGPLTVKFGTNNPQTTEGSHDYGYYFNQSGVVYKIIQGKRQTAAIATVGINQKIEICKEDSIVYLRFNNYRLAGFDIKIEAVDADKAFYGSVMIDKYNAETVTLSDLRHGEFTDTGNQIELGYLGTGRDEFAPYRSGGKSYIVIDRSGTGNFASSDVEYIPSDEVDESRYKIIFNNIFWDTDGNGKDMFTFGYKQGNLVAGFEPQQPTCVNNVAQEDGQINLRIKQGYKGFSYNLTNQDTKEEQAGNFYTDSIQLKNLISGTYRLILQELGGFNLYPKQTGGYENRAVGSIYFYTTTNPYMEWSVTNGMDAGAGMTTNATPMQNASTASIVFGLWVKNGTVYAIDHGTISTTSLGTAVQGDRLRVERNANTIKYKLNGNEVHSLTIPTEDRLAYNYPVAEVVTGGIYNLNTGGINTNHSWLTTDNMLSEKSARDSMTETIVLESDCDAAPKKAKTRTSALENEMIVFFKNASKRDAVVRLKETDTSATTLMVFSVSGALVQKRDLSNGIPTEGIDIKLPTTGVYIVKAITNTREYTAKILAN